MYEGGGGGGGGGAHGSGIDLNCTPHVIKFGRNKGLISLTGVLHKWVAVNWGLTIERLQITSYT